MLAAPAGAVVAVLAVLVVDLALRPVEAAAVLPVLPVLRVLVELAADLARQLLRVQALLQVVAVLVPDLVSGAVVAVPVVELPLSRHSSSAAMARLTIWPQPPYDPVPRSRWPPKGRPCPLR